MERGLPPFEFWEEEVPANCYSNAERNIPLPSLTDADCGAPSARIRFGSGCCLAFLLPSLL